MDPWQKTACVLCAQNCGLEVRVENNRITKVRPDRSNPRSRGYVCRKGLNIAYHQHHADRLRYPLKRTNGGFERISWEQAIDEIAARLRSLADTHGPPCFAYMGGGGQGCHFEAAVKVCGLDFERVREVCTLIATRRSSIHPDLGVLMNRHSTAASCLRIILMAVCGRIGVPGGNVIPGHLLPLGSHSDERDPKTWRTVETGFPAIMGVFPPNVMPEEILSDRPDRLRAVLCCGSNPLRSYADTSAHEKAFSRLDLLVTCELAMTETARRSHYVLPARSGYESWDGTFFAWTYPEVFFQMRRPAGAGDDSPWIRPRVPGPQVRRQCQPPGPEHPPGPLCRNVLSSIRPLPDRADTGGRIRRVIIFLIFSGECAMSLNFERNIPPGPPRSGSLP